MAVFMLSFTGVPPTLGFVGKFYLFRTVIEGGYHRPGADRRADLAGLGLLLPAGGGDHVHARWRAAGRTANVWLDLTAGAAAVATVLLSIFASPLFSWASQAVLKLYLTIS